MISFILTVGGKSYMQRHGYRVEFSFRFHGLGRRSTVHAVCDKCARSLLYDDHATHRAPRTGCNLKSNFNNRIRCRAFSSSTVHQKPADRLVARIGCPGAVFKVLSHATRCAEITLLLRRRVF